VTQQTQVDTSKGTVYITGPKIRGDFTSSVEVPGLVSMDVTSHMISDGEFIHTWTSLSNEGYKNAVSSKTEANTETGAVSFDQNLNYKCNPWNVDESKFLLPSDITFKTL